MKPDERKIVAQNKKARFNYQILEVFEAGIVLKGSEMKPIREGRVNISESFAEGLKGELFLLNCHISEYNKAGVFGHNPVRPKKLLLHRRQINKLLGAIKVKGQTLLPLSMYFTSRNLLKVEIGLAAGKKLYDKRADIKQRDWNRQKLGLLKIKNQ
jgi:SsrA-binding protein